MFFLKRDSEIPFPTSAGSDSITGTPQLSVGGSFNVSNTVRLNSGS